MPVVTTAFTAAAGTAWASSAWTSSDPAHKINTQITNWISAINDPTKIELVKHPGDATARTSFDPVHWLLRCRENDTSSDFGLLFLSRMAGISSGGTGTAAGYRNRINTNNNNGYGDFASHGFNISAQDLSLETKYFTAYDAGGSTPWLVVAMENAAKTSRRAYVLMRLDTSNLAAGSYYPASGIGKWVYFFQPTNSGASAVAPISSISAPYKGMASESSFELIRVTPTFNGNNYFFRLPDQYGIAHYLGRPTTDILVTNTTTGEWGDTVTIAGNTYTKFSENFWCRTA